MAMDFPAAPANGAVFTDPTSGAKYTFNGVGWTINGGGDASAHTIGDTLPASAAHGDLHWESDTGILWIYYADADSSQWVQAAGSGGGAATGDFVLKTGDTMTGGLTLSYSEPSIALDKTVATEQSKIRGSVGGVACWEMALGSNSGNNFALYNFDDAGVWVGAPLTIDRASGGATFTSNLAIRPPTGSTAIWLDKPASGQSCAINGLTNGVMRWSVLVGDPNLESGGTTGSDFVVQGYADDGSKIDNTRLIINRTSGKIQFGTPSNWWDPNGNMQVSVQGWQPAGGPWATGSDERIKTVNGDYTAGLSAILAINPVRYQYKGNDTLTAPKSGEETPSPHSHVIGKEFVGLVAQDVETIMPEMVTQTTGWIDGVEVSDYRTLNANALTYALINAVKQLSAANDALTARIAALEGVTP